MSIKSCHIVGPLNENKECGKCRNLKKNSEKLKANKVFCKKRSPSTGAVPHTTTGRHSWVFEFTLQQCTFPTKMAMTYRAAVDSKANTSSEWPLSVAPNEVQLLPAWRQRTAINVIHAQLHHRSGKCERTSCSRNVTCKTVANTTIQGVRQLPATCAADSRRFSRSARLRSWLSPYTAVEDRSRTNARRAVQ